MSSHLRAIAYGRVSTSEQRESGLGLDAQRATIEAECRSRGWAVVDYCEDAAVSGSSLKRRPALADAMRRLDAGEADVLVVAKIDRLSRSVHDAAGVLDRARSRGWQLVSCDLGVDTTTPAGEAMAQIMATFAQLERRMIGERTKDALAAKKRQGARLGRPRTVPDEVVERILDARLRGESWSAIGRSLDDDGVPTAQGGARWYPATVRTVAMSREAA